MLIGIQEKTLELTKILSQFIVEMKSTDIPLHIFEHAKLAFLDWLGVTLAGKDDPLVQKLIRYADLMGGNKQATILGYGMKTNLSQCALINGAASHVLDYDDTLEAFLGHPSVTIFPSLLALSEWNEKSGFDFLAAYIIGIQVGATIGACAGMEDHYRSGWHGTSTIGHFASAAACARLLELNEKQTVYALGIAGTQACGLRRSIGTMCKPLHAGRASQTGLLAALLAAEGFVGAEDILEGPNGFFEVLKGKINDKAVDALGKTWEIENLCQKYYPSCLGTHSPMEAAILVVQREGLAMKDIKSIRVYCSPLTVDVAGKKEPRTPLEAKFSIPYCVASLLIRGDASVKAFTDEKLNAPEVKQLMKKISVDSDKKMTTISCHVEVETVEGNVYSQYADVMKDIPELDLKKKKVRNKFIDLCIPILGDKKADKIMKVIDSLEKIGNIRTIIEQI